MLHILWFGIVVLHFSHVDGEAEEVNMCFEFTEPLEWKPVGAEKEGIQKGEE